ncbi:MAG: stage III sporulation protein AF [Firmicutes bacterium]|nr:stage III sporulation protein AF [Bacillota bacterium]
MGLSQVTVWIKQIIAAVFLAGFLEMLLPNNELKGATRLVMGLLVMMILLQPLTRILKMPTELLWSMPDTIISSKSHRVLPAADGLIQEGKRLREQWTANLGRNTQISLENRLRTMIAMIAGVTLREMAPVYRDGELAGLKLKVALAPEKNRDLRFQKTVERQIYQSVALFSNLPESRIEVRWDGGAGTGH